MSSVFAGPAYAGIPVTHREHSSQLTIFTGHEDPAKAGDSLDYAAIARQPGTRICSWVSNASRPLRKRF